MSNEHHMREDGQITKEETWPSKILRVNNNFTSNKMILKQGNVIHFFMF